MPLSTLTPLIKELSGRYDVFTETDALTTAGLFYLNAGQRLLDSLVTHDKMRAKFTGVLELGDFYYNTISNARSIEEVYIANSQREYKLDMDTYTLSELRSKYPQVPADISVGRPLYAALNVVRLAPGATLPVNKYKLGDIVAADEAIRGIIFYPPSDGDYEISVEGVFYSPSFALDADKSYWSEVHPDLLIEAMSYQMEVFLRNTEGTKDWLRDLQFKAFQRSMDFTWEGVSSKPLQMSG